jgi:hypothetical protein
MATIKICDICESRDQVTTQHYNTGEWQTDPAGGPSQELEKVFDLCSICELKVLRVLIKDYIMGSSIIKEIQRRISSKT